jgi:DNA-binding XRE family transcriptional regulator
MTKDYAKVVKRGRRKLGMNQVQFANLFGVHPITVSRWERKLCKMTPHQHAFLQVYVRGPKEAVEKLKLAIAEHGNGWPLHFVKIHDRAKRRRSH